MSTDPTRRRPSERQILDVIYRRYHRRFNIRLQKRFGNRQDAEDCVQEAFTRAAEFGALAQIPWLRAYANRVLDNLHTELVRRRLREREVVTVSSDLLEEAAEHPRELSAGMTEAELELDLAKMVMHMTGRRGQVFRLSFEGYTYPEIALQLGISESVVGQDLMHARKELRKMLYPSGGAADDNDTP